MHSPDRRRGLVVLAAVLATVVTSLVVAGVLLSGRAPDDAGSYRVRVLQDGRELASFTTIELEDLEMTEIVVAGLPETGPRVSTVLAAAGVKDYRTLTFRGMGVRDDGVIVVYRQDVDDQLILDIAYRGTVKVVGPRIAREDRVRDVTSIEVDAE